jgi:hypothetical protein
MINKPTDKQFQEIGEVIVNEAYGLFCDLGIEYDFCIQVVGGNCVVFGGTNRILWSVRYGFRLDVAYCNDTTVLKWGRMNGTPKYDC